MIWLSVVLRQLHVVSRTKTAVSHLHHPRLCIGARCPRLAALFMLFFGLVFFFRHRFFILLLLHLSQLLQRLGHALLALLGRSLPRRAPAPVAAIRVSIEFALKRLDLGARLFQAKLQRRAAAKRSRPRARSHPHPVLRHSVQFHQTLMSPTPPRYR